MHGFSYINRVTTAAVHFGLASTFDEDDQEAIDSFCKAGHRIIRISANNDTPGQISSIVLYQLGCDGDGQDLLQARLVDALVGAADIDSGLLVIIVSEDVGNGFISIGIAEFIEYFLIASKTWIQANKPFHVVICDGP